MHFFYTYILSSVLKNFGPTILHVHLQLKHFGCEIFFCVFAKGGCLVFAVVCEWKTGQKIILSRFAYCDSNPHPLLLTLLMLMSLSEISLFIHVFDLCFVCWSGASEHFLDFRTLKCCLCPRVRISYSKCDPCGQFLNFVSSFHELNAPPPPDGTKCGGCTAHARVCGADTGIFLKIRDCRIVLHSKLFRGGLLAAARSCDHYRHRYM